MRIMKGTVDYSNVRKNIKQNDKRIFKHLYGYLYLSDSPDCRSDCLRPINPQDAQRRSVQYPERCSIFTFRDIWRHVDGDIDRIVLGPVRNVKPGASVSDIHRACHLRHNSPTTSEYNRVIKIPSRHTTFGIRVSAGRSRPNRHNNTDLYRKKHCRDKPIYGMTTK